MRLIFFGSFQHYSVLILEALFNTPGLEVVGVVTTPPKPSGRRQILTQTPVHEWAEAHHLPVFTPETLDSVHCPLPAVDYLITAGYGKLLPALWLTHPRLGALNLHFSLLPKFRGANPAEWAILLGETETGITLIKMSPEFDTGAILAQAQIPIEPTDTRETLYRKLYELGAQKLPEWLLKIKNLPDGKAGLKLKIQPPISSTPPARRFTKDQSFLAWQIISAALTGQSLNLQQFPGYFKVALNYIRSDSNDARSRTPLAGVEDVDLSQSDLYSFLSRLPRALAGYPGVWTIINTPKGPKRLKLLTVHCSLPTNRLILDTVQLEGYNSSSYNQIKNQICQK